MEHAQELVRTVVRAFYEVEHVVIVEALLMHKSLIASDIGLLLGGGRAQKGKDMLKLCGRLKEGGLLST